jgi:hypothetical protein
VNPMTVLQAYKRAIDSDAPEQVIADRLYEGIKQVIDEGRTPESVLAVLHDLYLTADAEGQDVVRDAIAEVMDCVAGWTSDRATLQAS